MGLGGTQWKESRRPQVCIYPVFPDVPLALDHPRQIFLYLSFSSPTAYGSHSSLPARSKRRSMKPPPRFTLETGGTALTPTQQSIMPQVKLERMPIFCCSPLTPSVLTVSPEAHYLPLSTLLDLSPRTRDKRRQGIGQLETWGFQEAKIHVVNVMHLTYRYLFQRQLLLFDTES